MDTSQQKQILRQKMRTQLNALDTHYKSAASQKICLGIKEWLREHPKTKTIATFANLTTEPDLCSLLETMPHLNWLYPHSKPCGEMTFHRVSNTRELKKGLYGILEPKDSQQTHTTPDSIDCYLCPAFAYTAKGARLGKGGGYYDRLLSQRRLNSSLIGVCFSSQLLEQLPTESHDISVDHVFVD